VDNKRLNRKYVTGERQGMSKSFDEIDSINQKLAEEGKVQEMSDNYFEIIKRPES
jgi:soluble cytochrome b562